MDNKLGTFWPYKKGRIGIAKVPQIPFGFSDIQKDTFNKKLRGTA